VVIPSALIGVISGIMPTRHWMWRSFVAGPPVFRRRRGSRDWLIDIYRREPAESCGTQGAADVAFSGFY
jgi:hypothetical protein